MPILVCYDGSASARRAVSLCAETLAGNEVIVLHAWTPPVRVLPDSFWDPGGGTERPVDELEPVALERAREIAAEGRQLAESLGLAATGCVQRADSTAWRAILDAADSYRAEVIVLGTHGHNAAESTLLGSVANGVAQHSHLPVLVVPSPAG